MPTERIAMRRVREMLRLRLDAGLAAREVARRTGVAPSTLREMFQRFRRSGLSWPLPLELSEPDLETRLYGPAGTKRGHRRRVEPDWAAVNRELKRVPCFAAPFQHAQRIRSPPRRGRTFESDRSVFALNPHHQIPGPNIWSRLARSRTLPLSAGCSSSLQETVAAGARARRPGSNRWPRPAQRRSPSGGAP